MTDIAVTAILGIQESTAVLKSMNVMLNHVGIMETAWSAIIQSLFMFYTCTSIIQDELGGYRCTCYANWTGENCDTQINACDSNPCQFEATCTVSMYTYYSSFILFEYENWHSKLKSVGN